MIARLSGDAASLSAEKARLEEHLQSCDDWRALLQLRTRREKGEDVSGLDSAQLEAVLLSALMENPFFTRRQQVIAELAALAKQEEGQIEQPSASSALSTVVPAGAEAPPQDDLTRIRGIDANLMRRLHALDVTTFEDIADWWSSDVHHFAATLGVGSRISSQNWIEQAAMLSLARPGGPRMSAKAKAAAAAKAEAEAKAKAEAVRLAAEAKAREAAEAKARDEAEKAAAAAKAIADAAAKKVAEAAARIAAEAQAAAAAKIQQAEAEARARRLLAEREAAVAKALAEATSFRGPDEQTTFVSVENLNSNPGEDEPVIDSDAALSPNFDGNFVSSPALLPPNLLLSTSENLFAAARATQEKERPRVVSDSVEGPIADHEAPVEIHVPRPVTEELFRSAGDNVQTAANSSVRDSRRNATDADLIMESDVRKDVEPVGSAAVVVAPQVPRPPANPNSSIDEAIRRAVALANIRPRSSQPGLVPVIREDNAIAISDTREDGAGQRAELLPPISRELTPEQIAHRVRERRGEDIAEVIFDRTRYAAYRAKPEEANVDIVRRQRRDVARIPPPPVPTTAALEARKDLKPGASGDERFLKALKGN